MMNRKSGPNCNHNLQNGNETPSVMGLDTGDDVFVVASRTIGVPIYNNALWLQMSTIFVGKQMSMS